MPFSRRTFLIGAGTAPVVLALAPLPAAAVGKPRTQVVGMQHLQAPGGVLTALLDGHVMLGPEHFQGISEEEAGRLLEQAFLAPGAVATSVNAFLYRDGSRAMLIDAGGDGMFPETGRLFEALAAAGSAPEQIDTVLLTHLHPDHVGGMVKQDGTPAFPNAEVHVHADEVAFWGGADAMNAAPAEMKPFFERARTMLTAYGNLVRNFAVEKEVTPGITAVPLPGHTPGHSGYRLGEGAGALLVWGDVVHVAAFQFPKPDATIAFDADPRQAAETRRAIMSRAAEERLRIAGMHLPFPGVGHVAADGDGFRWVPDSWTHTIETTTSATAGTSPTGSD